MRPLLVAVILALASASSVSAQVMQDRYGPPRPAAKPLVIAALTVSPEQATGVPAAEPYHGPMLRWSGRPALVAAERGDAPRAAPEPPRTVRKLDATQPAQVPHPSSTSVAQPHKAPHMIGPEAAAQQAAPPAVAKAPAAPTAPPTPAPKVAVAALTPTPWARAGGVSPRFYSLHREYGMAPDAIPEQSGQPRYVLIGPPDTSKAAPAGDDDDDQAPASKKSNAVF
jgi:hypothetical protein